jgi:biotin transporter BioY
MGVFGPTAGYILGYFVVAYLADILRRKGLGITRSFLFMSLVIDVLGSVGMSLFFGFSKGFMLGFFPFLVGDFIKSIFFSAAARFFTKAAGR